MNRDKFTAMLNDGKDFIQIVQSIPEDKRFLLSMMADAFVNGMQAQERLMDIHPSAGGGAFGGEGR